MHEARMAAAYGRYYFQRFMAQRRRRGDMMQWVIILVIAVLIMAVLYYTFRDVLCPYVEAGLQVVMGSDWKLNCTQKVNKT